MVRWHWLMDSLIQKIFPEHLIHPPRFYMTQCIFFKRLHCKFMLGPKAVETWLLSLESPRIILSFPVDHFQTWYSLLLGKQSLEGPQEWLSSCNKLLCWDFMKQAGWWVKHSSRPCSPLFPETQPFMGAESSPLIILFWLSVITGHCRNTLHSI